MDVQLVVSMGKANDEGQDGFVGTEALREAVETKGGILVRFAPQTAIIPKCDAVITHSGMNTVMMALPNGVPMVLIPLTFEQPAIAARALAKGAGERILPANVNEKTVNVALRKVLIDESYRDRARQLGRDIAGAGGVKKAADIIE